MADLTVSSDIDSFLQSANNAAAISSLGVVSNATHTGDVTGATALTLATVNVDVGPYGGSTAIPRVTVNAKGLVTAVTTSAVVAPAGTLSGSTINATVTASSLTSVGVISSGVWQGSSIVDDYIDSSATWNAKQSAISFGTGVLTALGVNVGSAGAPVINGGTATGNTFTGYTETVVAIGNSGTSQTLAITGGTVQTCTLTGNCTFTMPTATAGKSFVLYLRSGAGGFTGTFTGVKWSGGTAPTITATASRMDILTFVADGTNWYGSAIQDFTP